MARKKTRLEKSLEGTTDVFGDLRQQGKTQSGLSDDVFGFKAEIKSKTKDEDIFKLPRGDTDLTDTTGRRKVKKGKQKFINTPYGRFPV